MVVVGLGRLRLSGEGTPKDEPAAAILFERACTNGEPAGCHNLATMLDNGQGIPKDPARARALYKKACDASVARACRALGK